MIDGTSNSRYSPVEGEKCLQKILPTNGVKKKFENRGFKVPYYCILILLVIY